MRAQMAHFQAKIGVFHFWNFGSSETYLFNFYSVYILILLIKSFH